jgi:hypothetical protein
LGASPLPFRLGKTGVKQWKIPWSPGLRDHDSKFDAFAAEVGKGIKDILELINVLNDEQTYC